MRTITVSGSHLECGRQIGAACAETLRQAIGQARSTPASGLRWDDYRRAAGQYLAATERAFPWIVDELRGAADGAAVDFVDLFVISVEEIFSTPPEPAGRCTDLAACSPATQGRVLLGHNNDLAPAVQSGLVGVEWALPDHPRLFTVGLGGAFVSIGVNSAGLALTGNELSPNDERPGIPRLLIARAILSARTFDEAIGHALHPDRASSYNNVIADAAGRIVNVEASATDHELLWPEDGWTVHTNHYVHPRMRQYERDVSKLPTSVCRYDRARHLMQSRSGPLTGLLLKSFLADHASSPASICRHDPNGRVKTVFSALIDLTAGTVEAAAGNPCEGEFRQIWTLA